MPSNNSFTHNNHINQSSLSTRFGSIKDAIISIHHAINYLKTRFAKMPKGARKENVPHEIKDAFKKVMDKMFGIPTWYESLVNKFYNNSSRLKTKESLYKAGTIYGISMFLI